MKKLHYHSDCPFFAGCENMIANFLNDERIQSEFLVSFSYRKTKAYEEGLSKRVRREVNSEGLSLLCEYELIGKITKVFPKPLALILKSIYAIIPFKYCIYIYNFYQCRTYLKHIQPDIIHINNGGYPAANSANAMSLAAKSLGIRKVVYVVNNIANNYSNPIRWYDYPIDQIVKSSVQKFITGSENAGRALKKVLSLPTHKWHKIYNGIAQRELRESPEEVRKRLGVEKFKFLIGVVALFEERKGHKYLIEAMSQIENATLLLEGDGPLKKEMEALVEIRNLEERVKFIGDEKHVFDFVNVLDLMVLPSIRNEDFPNVILEAMSLGKPVVATRIAGIPEQIIEGETGYVVEPASVDALSVAIRKIAGDDALAKSMGNKAKEEFEANFTVRKSVDKYIELYQAL